MNNEKLNAKELLAIASNQWANAKDIMIIGSVGRNKAYAIINGESIGQVASQTLHSMHVINNVTNYPIIRPVACFDKLEIIDIAKKIDTYETSILPYEDCCTVFVPKHPVINPSLDECIKQEEKIAYQEILMDTVKNTFTLKIKNEQEEDLKEFL